MPPHSSFRRSALRAYGLVSVWALSFFGVVASVRSEYVIAPVSLCVVLGVAASVQLALHKGFPWWMGVFAMFVGGPLFVIALPTLPGAGASRDPPE